MQGWVQEADGDRQPRHGLKDAIKVRLLYGQELGQGLSPALGAFGQDHGLDQGQAVGGHEHVLGAAEADALGPEFPGPFSVLGCVGIGPDPQDTHFIGPLQYLGKFGAEFGLNQGYPAEDYPAGTAVDGYQVAFMQNALTNAGGPRQHIDF